MIKACIFDAFGTLFKMALPPEVARDERAQKVLAVCRQKQLEYTWQYSLMGKYDSFDVITQMALDFGFKSLGIVDDDLKKVLHAAFFAPAYYEDVPNTLHRLKEEKVFRAILSNGSPKMLSDVVKHTRLGDSFDAIASVDAVQVFKPSPVVYQMVLDQLGLTKNNVLFLSSNQWDVAGAYHFGLRTAWINREGKTREPIISEGSISEFSSLDDILDFI